MTDLVDSLVRNYFPGSGNELVIGEVPVSRLARELGTPLYVYDRSVMDRKLSALRAALPERFRVHYSIKANPNRRVLQHFLSRGCGLEVASAGELRRALQAGCAPEKILFAGPGKTEKELEFALASGVGEIHLESLTEARRISAICKRLGSKGRVAIRVNPSGEAEGGAMRMGGRQAAFGIDEELLEEAVARVAGDPSLDLRGIHLFTGTQILDHAVLIGQYRHALDVARRVMRQTGRPLKSLDFGGGLGIPYFPHEKELDLAALAASLKTMCAEIDSDPDFHGTHFIVEPGRFLVGEAGIYVASVNDIKISRGKKFLILDGGMNHHLAASGNLGQTIKRNYPIAILNRLDKPREETVEIAGPLCTPLDVLGRAARLPQAEIGDLVGVFQSGAYGPSASPSGFLSHPPPREVWVDGKSYAALPDEAAGAAIEPSLSSALAPAASKTR